MWLLVLILGTITYYLIKRTVAPITDTPVWIVWLIMMGPALIWTIWYEIVGGDKPIPTSLIVIPLIAVSYTHLTLPTIYSV